MVTLIPIGFPAKTTCALDDGCAFTAARERDFSLSFPHLTSIAAFSFPFSMDWEYVPHPSAEVKGARNFSGVRRGAKPMRPWGP